MPEQIVTVPVAELYIHPLNPRTHRAAAEIEAKAKSLEVLGQIHNLACYRDPEREGLGVVAGGYRLLGFQRLEAANPGAVAAMGDIACRVTDDPLIAEAWAVAENVTQVPLAAAEVDGAGTREITGIGAVFAGSVAISGIGEADGAGTREITGIGAVFAGSVAISGIGEAERR